MGIIRVEKNTDFVVMDKTGLEDDRLSFKAKGILAYLLSKPDNWYCHRSHLEKVGTDGQTAVRSGLKELKEYGYLEKTPVRDEEGKIQEWKSVIREVPKSPADRQSDQKVENPPAGDSTRRQSHQPNKELDVNKELNKRSKKKTHARTQKDQADRPPSPPALLANKFQQVFDRELSSELYSRMLEYYHDTTILMEALKLAEVKADKPAYLLKILADWHENGLEDLESIIAYVDTRGGSNSVINSSEDDPDNGGETSLAGRLHDADYLRQDGWN